MKTGIIIPCYNVGKKIDVANVLKFISLHNRYHLCFVNSSSKDNTQTVLSTIKREAGDSVSIIDVKRNSSKSAAVRAGARYLFSRPDIDTIGYIDAEVSGNLSDFEETVSMIDASINADKGNRNQDNDDNNPRNGRRNFVNDIVKKSFLLMLGLPVEYGHIKAVVFKRFDYPFVYQNEYFNKWLVKVTGYVKVKTLCRKLGLKKMTFTNADTAVRFQNYCGAYLLCN